MKLGNKICILFFIQHLQRTACIRAKSAPQQIHALNRRIFIACPRSTSTNSHASICCAAHLREVAMLSLGLTLITLCLLYLLYLLTLLTLDLREVAMRYLIHSSSISRCSALPGDLAKCRHPPPRRAHQPPRRQVSFTHFTYGFTYFTHSRYLSSFSMSPPATST